MENILHLEGENLQIKGATKVVSSTPSQAVIEVKEKIIVVSGNDIEVKKLSLEEGEVDLKGKFTMIKFSSAGDKKQPFIKRIFK